ncbi:glycosyltransferase family 9 protein [Desulfobacterota bacterium M19]
MFVKGGELKKDNIKNILLIQFGDIGDVVYSFPCARALKETFPAARVVMAVQKKAEGLVHECRWADDVIVVDKKKMSLLQLLLYQKKFWIRVRNFQFDLAVDLRTGSRGAILAFLSGAHQRIGRYTPVGNIWRARLFSHLVSPKGRKDQYIAEYYHETLACYGISTTALNPEINPARNRNDAVAHLLQHENIPQNKPILAVQPFSLWQYKEWKVDNYIKLINKVTKSFDISVIITGSPAETVRARTIVDRCDTNKVFNLAGLTALDDLPALLQKACLFLGVDSAGVHIAAAVGTPTVSLYGPSSSDIWAPKGEKHKVVSSRFPCIPCKETGCGNGMKSCCMNELTVDEVWSATNKKLLQFCD